MSLKTLCVFCASAWGQCGHAKARPYSANTETRKLYLLSHVLYMLSEKEQKTKGKGLVTRNFFTIFAAEYKYILLKPIRH